VNGSQIQSSCCLFIKGSDSFVHNCAGYRSGVSGSAGAPSFSWTANTNTGIFNSGTSYIGYSLNGTEMFRMTNNGGFGDFHATANIIGYSSTPSDERLKDNVKDLENSLGIIEKLRPVSYTWKDVMRRGNDFGLIAQEVEKVIPEIVTNTTLLQTGDDEEYKTISYERLVPFLIQSIQELNNKIKELEKK
jgi:hypothetical protein